MNNGGIILFLQPSDPAFASQTKVYQDIGEEMLLHAFEGMSKNHVISSFIWKSESHKNTKVHQNKA